MHHRSKAFEAVTTLNSTTGAAVRLYVELASGEARGVVHINHGLAEHAGRYQRFAVFLAGHGFHVYAHDHRGHGHTTAPDAPLGAFGDGGKVLEDVLAIHGRIAARHPGLPIILFGHSMGAMIALTFLARHPGRVHAAALWNMPLPSRPQIHAAKTLLAWERFRLGSDVPSWLLPQLTFQHWANSIPHARTPFDFLTRDPKAVERYIADPLCGWNPSVGMWRTLFEFVLTAHNAERLDAIPKGLPIHIVGGEADVMTGRGKAIRHLENRLLESGFSDVQTKIYPNARHESLNELNRDLIMEDFLCWAEKVTG